MRAVNLIPDDLRRGSSAAGRSGPAVYVLLGVLGVLVVLVTAWALTGRQVADRQSDLARAQVEAQAAEARAGALEPYARFAELRAKRVETVTSLSRSRFNWAYALREISRVVPGNVWLTALTGTVAPGVAVEGSTTGGATSLRAALPVPAVELSGCSTSQKDVARYLARLRSVDGVTRVSLASSEKADEAGAAGASNSGDGGDCRQGSDQAPKFEAVVFFERSTAKPAAGGTAGAAPAAGSAPAGKASSSTPTSGSAPSTGSTK